jgi:hypothetical protein
MESFEIRNRKFIIARKGLGIFFIIIAILWFITSLESKKIIYPLAAFFFAFYGIYQLTNGLGIENCWFKTGDNFIIIKWIDSLRPVQIHDTGIVKISIERSRIIIFQKSRKPLKLNLSFLEREQRKEVYDFIINYTKQRNLTLEKHSSTLL